MLNCGENVAAMVDRQHATLTGVLAVGRSPEASVGQTAGE